MKNYGLIIDVPKVEDYVLGGWTNLPKQILRPDGQWDEFLPLPEFQNINSIETQACVSFGTLSAVEMIYKRLYGEELNWSDRWLAWNSGTNPDSGNSPNIVAETLRKTGCPYQNKWDFISVSSPQEFYKTPPPKLFDCAKEDFYNPIDFKHEWVNPNEKDVKEALMYSPVGISAYAWIEKDGICHRPENYPENHWIVLYGYRDDLRAWKVFDSYDNVLKFYSFDSKISIAKRFWIQRKTIKQSCWKKLLAYYD